MLMCKGWGFVIIMTIWLQALQKDIAVHREHMIRLDKTGTHLKYFSQKQDVVIIKNLLFGVQQRWEKIVSRSAERTRHLERGYKEAIQVHVSLIYSKDQQFRPHLDEILSFHNLICSVQELW